MSRDVELVTAPRVPRHFSLSTREKRGTLATHVHVYERHSASRSFNSKMSRSAYKNMNRWQNLNRAVRRLVQLATQSGPQKPAESLAAIPIARLFTFYKYPLKEVKKTAFFGNFTKKMEPLSASYQQPCARYSIRRSESV